MATIDKPRKIGGFDEWEVQSAAETLQRAFEIKSKPKLFAAARKMLRQKTAAAQKAIRWSDGIK